MKRTHLIPVAVLAIAFAAGAAHAESPVTAFHRLADADNLVDAGPGSGRGFVPAWHAVADADNLEADGRDLAAAPALDVAWHGIADADTDASAGTSRMCTAGTAVARR